MMSGRFRSALRRVPATKPSCTESVNQLTAPALRCHSFVRAGTTAEPLNQSDMPNNSAIASSASMRQRKGEASFDEEGLCKPKIVAQRKLNGSQIFWDSTRERTPSCGGRWVVVGESDDGPFYSASPAASLATGLCLKSA